MRCVILCYNVLTICSANNRLALKIWSTFVLQLEDEVKEMVLEPVYLARCKSSDILYRCLVV
jgi:hypothetical protein